MNAETQITVAQTEVGWRFLRSRRWLGYFAMLLIFSVACVLLGNWQFERRAQARAEIARIDTNYDASPVALSQVLSVQDSFDVDAHKWLPVELHGIYVGDVYLVRNRPGPNGVGSNLVQAFETDDGSVMFIDRGWVPVLGAEVMPSDLPAAPQGGTTVVARLKASEPEISGRSAAGNSVPSINLPMLAALAGFNTDVYTSAYGQLISELPATSTGTLADRPERDEGPHLSYALQWYVFILIGIVGVAYAARQEYRSLNAGGDVVKKQDERSAARRQRKGPSDADEEDALIDG